MKTRVSIVFVLIGLQFAYSQRILLSWGQQTIENYTHEMYDEAQLLTTKELLEKNLNVNSWSEVFLLLNASLNHHSNDSIYMKELTKQLTNMKETKLSGTSRLIIWERIVNGDIIFEGKGLLFENDLFTVSGRANQLLQSLTNKNFGYVNMYSTPDELEILKEKWIGYLNNESVEEYVPRIYENAKISEVSSPIAVEALIVSLKENQKKNQIIEHCLKYIYGVNEMPISKDSPETNCNPDKYVFAYLAMLFGDEKVDESKDSKWWLDFWIKNKSKMEWNTAKGSYEIIK